MADTLSNIPVGHVRVEYNLGSPRQPMSRFNPALFVIFPDPTQQYVFVSFVTVSSASHCKCYDSAGSKVDLATQSPPTLFTVLTAYGKAVDAAQLDDDFSDREEQDLEQIIRNKPSTRRTPTRRLPRSA